MPCDCLGSIAYDLTVRKFGTRTEQTFGMITGLHAKTYDKDESATFVLSGSSITKQKLVILDLTLSLGKGHL
jgi:hypothetical protein